MLPLQKGLLVVTFGISHYVQAYGELQDPKELHGLWRHPKQQVLHLCTGARIKRTVSPVHCIYTWAVGYSFKGARAFFLGRPLRGLHASTRPGL